MKVLKIIGVAVNWRDQPPSQTVGTLRKNRMESVNRDPKQAPLLLLNARFALLLPVHFASLSFFFTSVMRSAAHRLCSMEFE
jgi:hypothetical protein